MPDDESGERAAESPWAEVAVPDDIRDLARDIAAYRREVRRAERARRRRQLLARRGVVPALVVSAAVVLAGVVAAMLTVLAPQSAGRPPAAAPLASPNLTPGTVGGLLPHLTLRAANGGSVDTRSAAMRPAVLALVPLHCGCRDVLNGLAGQAYSEQMRLAVVVPSATDDGTAAVAAGLERGVPLVYYDASGALATAVSSDGVTIVLVDRDGTIYEIERGITDPTTTSLDAALQSMLLPGRT